MRVNIFYKYKYPRSTEVSSQIVELSNYIMKIFIANKHFNLNAGISF